MSWGEWDSPGPPPQTHTPQSQRFVPLMTTILENKPFNFRRDTKFGDAVHIASCNCFGVKKNKEARRARRLQRKRLTEVNSMKSANNLDHETSAVMGMTLGASFTRSLFTCVNAEAAVDEWFLQEIFLEEMAAFNPWFLPMLTEIGHVLLMRAPWGLWLRIGIIFVLNYLNIALDFYLIHKNLISEDIASGGDSEGEGCDGDGDGGELMSPKLLGYAMLACYGLQLIAKVCLSNEQNRFVDKDELYKIRDIILTFLFFNPVEETYKIVKNSHKNGNEVFEPHMLLLAEKQLDLTFGDLPVIFCQMCNLMALTPCNSDNANILLGNIILSFFIVGYNQSTLAYYGDTDPVCRRKTPEFFGAVPDSIWQRIFTIAFIWFFVSGFVTCKIVACGFLFVAASPMVLAIWIGECGGWRGEARRGEARRGEATSSEASFSCQHHVTPSRHTIS